MLTSNSSSSEDSDGSLVSKVCLKSPLSESRTEGSKNESYWNCFLKTVLKNMFFFFLVKFSKHMFFFEYQMCLERCNYRIV